MIRGPADSRRGAARQPRRRPGRRRGHPPAYLTIKNVTPSAPAAGSRQASQPPERFPRLSLASRPAARRPRPLQAPHLRSTT